MHRAPGFAPDPAATRAQCPGAQHPVENDPAGLPSAAQRHRLDELTRSLDETRARLDLMTGIVGIWVWRHDLGTDRVFVDEAGWPVIGLPPHADGWPLAKVRERIHPDDLAAVRASAQRTLADGRPTDVEARYLHVDGTWHYVLTRRTLQRDAEGRAVAFVGVSLDVSDRVEESRRAVDLARRLEATARAARIGLWSMNIDGGSSQWNAQMFDLFGLPHGPRPPRFQELLQDIVHPDDRRRVRRDGYRWIHHGERAFEIEYRIVRPDGSLRWLLNRCDVDEGQGVRRLYGVTMDVTEARVNEAERQERIAAQHESRAKSRLLARMSHELRTPLNAVLGFTQLMLAEGTLPEAQRTRAAHVHAAGEHLLSLINDVLDLSSLEGGEMRMQLGPVGLAAALRETLPLVEGDARRRGIAVQCGALDEVVRADATRLRQVLLNLLSNAIKYNRDGGRVVVEASGDGTAVRLAVHDTGRGLAPAQLAHLFEPFNRLGAETEGIEGTGIGLAVVKSIVAAMGGRVDATSEPGIGSTFTVHLEDARHAARASGTAVPPPATAPEARRGRLLYIEDNPVNVVIVEELIAHCPGLTLASEPDGTRGVQRARELQPDLVLVDMQLPDMDGHEVLQRLRAEPATARIPCIALSANAMPEDISRALAAGFADYWTKPIDFRAFTASLQALFASR